MYKRKSRLSARKQGRLIEYFVAGTTARAAAELVDIQANTAIRFFMRLRQLIASKHPSYALPGEIEVDESYVAAEEKSKRRKSNMAKTAVFGLLKQDGKVYTAILPNPKTGILLPIREEKVMPHSVIYKDTSKNYTAFDMSSLYYRRINPSQLLTDRPNQIDDIENFWSQAKRHLRKFNGIKPDNFYWFLKECEWRFNGGNHKTLLKKLKYWYKHSHH